jgi:hypothetical protein
VQQLRVKKEDCDSGHWRSVQHVIQAEHGDEVVYGSGTGIRIRRFKPLSHAMELIKHQNGASGSEEKDAISLEPSPLYQDNKSTIALVKVGRATHEKSRHINIRHFWIHGKVKDKSVVIEYIPTELTIANVLTKPLQDDSAIKPAT